MTTKPACARCGYKMKSMYQRTSAKAAFNRVEDWYYCPRDNWVVNTP